MATRGVTAADLARKTGLSKPTLSAILNGTTTDPRVSSLLGIARILSCDPMWLFVGRASSEYAASTSVSRVPIWELKDMTGQPQDALPLIDTGRHLIVEEGGHFCAVLAENDDLAKSGINKGDTLIIDMSREGARLESDDIALVDYKNRFMLLKARNSIDGMVLLADDPHFGFVKADDAHVIGKMIELRRI